MVDKPYIHRDLENTMMEAARYFPVITVTGPRQSGKTSLIRNLFPKLPYYSLENDNILDFALHDPIAFLSQDKNGMVLDEVQNAPRLLSYIQQRVDENPKLRYIVSGSSQFAVLKEISQSLAGRSAVFELLPFSLNEIDAQVEDKKTSIDNLLYQGLYPAVATGQNTAALAYPAYIRTYMEKDLMRLLQIGNLRAFRTFLKLCAGRIGSLFNASELANEVGVSSNTISSWLSVLEASYLVFLLEPYHENLRKRLTKSPKIYFTDTGLAASLLGINSAKALQTSRMRGPLFENLVIAEALKHRFNQGLASNLFFYRDAKGNEVDLLLEDSDGLRAMEIKSSMTYNTEFEKTLKMLPKWINRPVKSRSVIYNGTLENIASEIRLRNIGHLNEELEL